MRGASDGNAEGSAGGDAIGRSGSGDRSLGARMHTAEHLLSAVMRRRFGAPRPVAAHLDGGRKGRCDYIVSRPLVPEDVVAVEAAVRSLIAQDLSVSERRMSRAEAAAQFDLEAVPPDVKTVRLVAVDGVDETPCSGAHVRSTAAVGGFRIASFTPREGGVVRLRFRVDAAPR